MSAVLWRCQRQKRQKVILRPAVKNCELRKYLQSLEVLKCLELEEKGKVIES